VFASYLIRVRARSEIDPGFLSYFFRSDAYWRQVNAQKNANLKKGVSGSLLKTLIVPVPPLQEQRKIAAVLGLVQRAIEQQERLIALTTELKKALLHKLFTEGLRGEPQKQTEIGPVPESWEVVRLSDSVSITNGQIDPGVPPFSEMLHVGPENIEPGTGRLLNLQTNSELRIHSGNYHFTADDVLYSKIRPYLNKVALPNFEGTCSADMYPLRAKNRQFVRSFLFQLLLSPQFNKQAISFQDRTGIPKINRAQLGSILLPKPNEAEQLEIADTLSLCDRRGDAIQQKLRSLTDLFHTLLHQLMTAQIRVNELDLTELGAEVGAEYPAA
jgi:type I restriction enzyme S subunit